MLLLGYAMQQRVKQCKTIKYLGVHLDDNLKWHSFIDHVNRRVSRVISVIYNVRNNLTLYSLRLLYHSLNCILNSHLLQYCVGKLWGNTIVGSLYNTQNKLVRAISFSGRCGHTAPLFRKFNLLTISQISSYMSALFVHKSLQNESNRFFNIYNCEHHSTRRNNSNSLALPNILTTHSRQSIRWMGCKV